MAPAESPVPVIERLNKEVNAYIKSPEGQKMLADFDVDAMGGTPQAARNFIRTEAEKWRTVIQQANIKL